MELKQAKYTQTHSKNKENLEKNKVRTIKAYTEGVSNYIEKKFLTLIHRISES